MKTGTITPQDFYTLCYNLPPDILVSVFSATRGNLPLWTGELRSMPRVYYESIIDHMFICADDSKITKLILALKDQKP
jgi:hypothetical protein